MANDAVATSNTKEEPDSASESDDESILEQSSFHSDEIWENPLSEANSEETEEEGEEERFEREKREKIKEEEKRANMKADQANRRASIYIETSGSKEKNSEDMLGYLYSLMEGELPPELVKEEPETSDKIFSCLQCETGSLLKENIVEFLPCKHIYCNICITEGRSTQGTVLCLYASCPSTHLIADEKKQELDIDSLHVSQKQHEQHEIEPGSHPRVKTKGRAKSEVIAPETSVMLSTKLAKSSFSVSSSALEDNFIRNDYDEEPSTSNIMAVACPRCDRAVTAEEHDLVICRSCNFHFCFACLKEMVQGTKYHTCASNDTILENDDDEDEKGKKRRKRRNPISKLFVSVRNWLR